MMAAVVAAAFVCVGAVSYEAGARGLVRRTADVARKTVEAEKCETLPTITEIDWTVADHQSYPAGSAEAWRQIEAESNLFTTEASLFVGADDMAIQHLHNAANALKADQDERIQKAGDELEAAAGELKQGKASSERIHEVIQNAFNAMAGVEK
jgi:hypothetical protein